MKIPLLLVVMMVGCAGKQKDPPKTSGITWTDGPVVADGVVENCPCVGKDLNQHCWMKAGEIQYPEGCTFLHAKKPKPAAPRVASVNDAEEGWKGNPRVVPVKERDTDCYTWYGEGDAHVGNSVTYTPVDPSADAPGDFHPHRGDSADDYVKPFSMSQLNCDDKDQQCLQKKAQSITDMMNEALPEKQEKPPVHCLIPEGCYRPPPPQMPFEMPPGSFHVSEAIEETTVKVDPKSGVVTVTTPNSIIVITPKEKP